MKKLINFTVKGALLLVMAVTVFSCSKNQKESKDYYTLIPNDAKMVLDLNMSNLLTDANLTQEQWDKFEELTSLPKYDNSGLDAKAKVYAFITNKNTVGIVGKVSDVEKLKKTLSVVTKDICDGECSMGEYEGYKTQNWPNAAVAYNNNALIIIAKCSDMMNETIDSCDCGANCKCAKGNCCQNKACAKVESCEVKDADSCQTRPNAKKVICPAKKCEKSCAETNCNNCPDSISCNCANVSAGVIIKNIISGSYGSIYQKEWFKNIVKGNSDISMVFDNNNIGQMPSDINMGQVVLNTDFEKGKIITKTDNINSSIEADINNIIAKPKYKFNNYIPATSFIYSYSAVKPNADFTSIFNVIKEQIEIQKSMTGNYNTPINGYIMDNVIKIYEQVFNSLNGEIAFAANIGGLIPQVYIYLDVKNNEFINSLIEKIPANILKKDGEDQYTLTYMIPFKLGIKDGVLYFTNDTKSLDAMFNKTAIPNNFESTPFAKKITNTYGGLFVDIPSILNYSIVKNYIKQIFPGEIPFLSGIETIECVNETPTKGIIEFNIKDKSKNSLQWTIENAMELNEML